MALTKVIGAGLGTVTSADLDGAVTVNESSADKDFRVESNGNANMLFVDGGNDGVGIGTSSVDTNATMTVSNTGDNHAISIVGALNKSRIHFQGANTGSASTDGLVIGLSSSDDTNDDSALIGLKESGSMTFQTGATNRLQIGSTGHVLFHGITGRADSSSGHMSITDQSSNRSFLETGSTSTSSLNLMVFINPNGPVGTITTSGSSTSFVTSSDYRLKENVSYDFDATTRLKQLKPARFNFIADADTIVDGFLAHEVQSIVPEAITGTHNQVEVWEEDEELPDGVSVGDNKLDDDGNTIPVYQGIDQAKLVPLLVKSLQEALTEIDTLKTKVAALEKA